MDLGDCSRRVDADHLPKPCLDDSDSCRHSMVVGRHALVLCDCGLELTMISSMLVAIVTVIGIATTMHWLHHFQSDHARGGSKIDVVRSSLRSVFQPLAWACLTDAIAFAALLMARVEPIRDYGAMMCVASLVTLIGVLCLGPGLVLLFDFPQRGSTRDDEKSGMNFTTARYLEIGIGMRRTAIATLFIAIILVVVGTPRLTIETDFLKNFRPDSNLVEGYQIVERELSGAGVWDAVIPAPTPLSEEYLRYVSALEARLKDLPGGGPTKIISLVDAEAISRLSPLLSLLPLELRLAAMRTAMPDFYDSMLQRPNPSGIQSLRIMLRAREAMSSAEKQQLISSVRREIEEAVSEPAFVECFAAERRGDLQAAPPIVTGYYVLLPKLVESVIADQWICLGAAMLGIGTVLWLAIGDWKLALIALIANTLPSLACVAFLGIVNIPINLGVVMIAAVSLGLSVDSSLHYLIDYRRRRRAGETQRSALHLTQRQIGTPIICSSLSLILGFLSLCTSDFLPTVWFGGMAAAAIVMGMFANLIWLPVFLTLVETSDR